MSFIRTIESFRCEKCGHYIEGNGYTNHCPECLWSKHVDIDPGDRQSKCDGMMCPKYLETRKKGENVIIHECEKCGHQKPNTSADEDNFDTLLTIARRESDSKEEQQ